MASDERIEIPVNNDNLVWRLLGAAVFMALGVWFFVLQEVEFLLGITLGAVVLQVVGGILIFLFGLVMLYGIWELADNRPGLVIGPEGIVDRTHTFSVGLVPWDQIRGFRIRSLPSKQILTVELVDPEQYIARGNLMQRLVGRFNSRLYESPVQISARLLEIDFEELIELLEERCERNEKVEKQKDLDIKGVTASADATVD